MAHRALLVVYSYHHKNAEAVARAFAPVLDARVVTPQETGPEELNENQLVGFGSGGYGARHHALLLGLVDRLPHVSDRNAFIFSTFGAPAFAVTRKFVLNNHSALRDKLLSKGYGDP